MNKQSEELKRQYDFLRLTTVKEIEKLVRMHIDIKEAIEFEDDIFYSIDDQDSAIIITNVHEDNLVTLEKDGIFMGEDNLLNLSTTILLNVLSGLEVSYETAKEYGVN